MWRPRQDSERTERARAGLRDSRARKRARRRLPGSPGPAGVGDRARGLATRAGWLVLRLLWAIQERALWPASDRLERAGGRPAGLTRPLAGAICAIAVVATVAGATLAAGGGEPGPSVAGAGSGSEPQSLEAEGEMSRPVIAQRTEDRPDGPVLSGARPRFQADPSEEVERARRIIAARQAASEGEGSDSGEVSDGSDSGEDGNSTGGSGEDADGGEASGDGETGAGDGASGDAGDPGADPESEEAGRDGPGAVPLTSEGSDLTPREQARRVAHRFTRAFLAYEIGRESEAIDAAFGETASPRLVESLQDRPPRLPRDGRVPRAQIVNVVDGPREGRRLEVSASLLRVNGLSELRLDLFRGSGGWRVGAVKG